MRADPHNNIVVRHVFASNSDPRSGINLTRVGYLYILISLLQAGWLWVVLLNWETAMQFVAIPIFGWPFVCVWVGMAWLVVHLLYIGVRMIQLSRTAEVRMRQTENQRRKLNTVIVLLLLGVAADLAFFLYLPGIRDKEVVIFLSGLMGSRIAWINMEAVLQYHNK